MLSAITTLTRGTSHACSPGPQITPLQSLPWPPVTLHCRNTLTIFNTILFKLTGCILIFIQFNKISFFGCPACRIIVPRPGIEPTPPEVEAWSLNHWTDREVPTILSVPSSHPIWSLYSTYHYLKLGHLLIFLRD